MEPQSILWPSFAMVAITALVWVVLYVHRIGEMMRKRIDAQRLASASAAAALLDDRRASDNFRNLFELPVLFHVGVLIAFVTREVDALALGLAWAFVALRGAHSFVHCSYNRVMHRFIVYVLSTLALFAFWGQLAWALCR